MGDHPSRMRCVTIIHSAGLLLCVGALLVSTAGGSPVRQLLQTSPPINCIFEYNGKKINLNSLKGAIQLATSSTGDGNTYALSVCGEPVAGCGMAQASAGCQTSFGGMKMPIGNPASMTAGLISSNDVNLINNRTVVNPKIPPLDWGVTLVFPKLDQQSSDLTISIPCDPNIRSSTAPLQNMQGVPFLLPEVLGDSRGSFFAIPHAAGCPVEDGDGGAAVDVDDSSDGSSGMSGGWIFIIVFLSVLLAYCG